MPKEKKSDREKKAATSKAASKESTLKEAKAASVTRRKTARSESSAKPALKRHRTRKTPVADEAVHTDQPLDYAKAGNLPSEPILHEHISVRAYYLSEELRACGEQWDSERIWLEAERQIRAERK